MSDIYDMLDGITRLCAAGLHSSGMELQISANEALAVCGAAFERCREQFHERDADNERLRSVLEAAREAVEEWSEFRDHEAEMTVLAEKIRLYDARDGEP